MEDEDVCSTPSQLPPGVPAFIQFATYTNAEFENVPSSSPEVQPNTAENIICASSSRIENQSETSSTHRDQEGSQVETTPDPEPSGDTQVLLENKVRPAKPKVMYKDIPFIAFTIIVAAITTTALVLTRPQTDVHFLRNGQDSLDFDVTNRCLRKLRYQFLGVEAFRLEPTAAAFLAIEWLAVQEGACKSLEVNSTFMEQRYALLSMFFEMGGKNWGSLHGWANVPNIPECHWDNIGCNDLSLVTKIELGNSGQSIDGHLSSEIGRLSALTSLKLQNGNIKGTIPSEIFRMTNLEYLNLENNFLSGTIHPSIGNLRALTSLFLTGNIITGTNPPEMKSLVSLKQLYLESNAFSGFPWSYISAWQDIEAVYVSECTNQVDTIPSEIGNLSMLKTLAATNTCAMGSIPTEIGNLAHLEKLIFVNNPGLSNTIPSEVGRSTSLKSLNIRETQLTGSLPSEIGQLTNLNEFFAFGCMLAGTIPVEMEHASSLQLVDIGGNTAMSGTVPTWLCSLDLNVPCQLSCSCCTSPCD